MKLKRLEINGFKSFVDRTLISFEKDITAIVGPNGCGKSNVVDAIRWVMGEQSPRLLRGKSMEDVIFAGSDKRAAVSMASVELTFSTEGYHTPPAYSHLSEISVCRRLYRSGDSEYLINKTPSRLKDITDLFLGTGIGTRAYSMVEQGRVYQFLTAKPEERRHYIEEAAGISKFKSRKEAALRKMEATRQNLQRLQDLVLELDRQMTTLDRQAKKAEKYRELKTEFQAVDLAYLSTLYAKGLALQTEQETLLREFSEKEASFKADLLTHENTIETERLNIGEKERELSQLQNELFEVTNTVQVSETSLNYQRAESEQLKERVERLSREESQLRVQHEDISNQATEKLIEEEASRQDQLRLADEKRIGEENLRTDEEMVRQLQSQVESLQRQIYQADNRLGQLVTMIASSQAESEKVTAELEGAHVEMAECIRLIEETRLVYQSATSAFESIKQLKLDLAQQTDDVASELNNCRQNLKQEEEELIIIKEKLVDKKSRLYSLEELQRNFEGYQEGTRSILRRQKENNLEGLVGTIADCLETRPEYESAVSAVLGDKLQYVLVRSEADGIEAVEYLKNSASGRSSFLPLSLAKSITHALPVVADGVVGVLRDFVTVKDNNSALADFLFGDVLLVTTLRSALDLWINPETRRTFVTLDGEVVDRDGVITGGSGGSPATVILSMKRESRELTELIQQIELDVRQKETERLTLSMRVGDLERTLEAVKRSSHEEEIKLNSHGKDVAQYQKEIDYLEQRRQGIEVRQNRLSQRVAELNAHLMSSREEQNTLQESRIMQDQELQHLKVQFEVQQQQLIDKKEELSRLSVALAQVAERHIRLVGDLAQMQRDANRLLEEATQRNDEARQATERMAVLEVEQENLKAVIEQKLLVRDDLQTRVRTQKEEYDQAVVLIQEKEVALKDLRRLHEEAMTGLNQATIELTQIRSDLKRLVEQTFERHASSLDEIYGAHQNLELDLTEAEQQSLDLRQKLSRLGEVNTAALQEFEEIKTRHDFLRAQKEDLEKSLDALHQAIVKINRTTREKFTETFHAVNERFQQLFPKLFMGGRATLLLTDPENILESGIEVMAQPPGKKNQNINLLSGGEKALTAVSLIFSIFQIRPSPFCILDEVDAPLDESNVGRFNELIREMTGRTQFIVITHNKKSMQMSDVLYGVTMQEPGVSQLVSVAMS